MGVSLWLTSSRMNATQKREMNGSIRSDGATAQPLGIVAPSDDEIQSALAARPDGRRWRLHTQFPRREPGHAIETKVSRQRPTGANPVRQRHRPLADTSELEAEIDRLVYTVYGLMAGDPADYWQPTTGQWLFP